jgi:hypothetical protein
MSLRSLNPETECGVFVNALSGMRAIYRGSRYCGGNLRGHAFPLWGSAGQIMDASWVSGGAARGTQRTRAKAGV